MIGQKIHRFAETLWPINRSLTGDGVRKTLRLIQSEVPDLKIFEVPTGTRAFDWVIPKEWRVNDAYIVTPSGQKICDFKTNNLHLVGYSTPISRKICLSELQNHLHSLPSQPNAIPYITSYYKEAWGFCLSHQDRVRLVDGEYEVCVDTELFDGSLTYGEIFIKGKTLKEVLISTYICHPSMANNEISGPCVATFLAKSLKGCKSLNNSYRLIFVPETIGSIAYLSRNITSLKQKVIAGFNVTCVGDDRCYSYLPSRNGETLSDQVAQHVLKYIDPNFKKYTWSNDRGSDERQYCAPGVDLPIASIMRSKYDEYPEYHTSLDDLISVVTPGGLDGGYNALWKSIQALENNCYPKMRVLGEPQLGKRNLYPSQSTKSTWSSVKLMMNLITWSDGTRSLIEIAELCNTPVWELYSMVEELSAHNLMDLLDAPAY